MSAGYSLPAVASKLRARVVPAELANATVAACLMEYAKDLMGADGVAMAAHVVAHGLVKGGELEHEEPFDFLERLEIARTALLYALDLNVQMRTAPADFKCRNITIRQACSALAAALDEARQQVRWAEGQDREAVLELSIGLEEYMERGYMSLTKSSATPLMWSALGVGNVGGLRDFACSVRDAVIVRGGVQAAVARGALFATAAMLNPSPGLVMSSSPLGVRFLPCPLGARHEERSIPNEVDVRLRWLWSQSSHTTELGEPRGASRNDCHREGRDYAGRDSFVLYLELARFFPVIQPIALCEAFRLAEGPWALPRPPEPRSRAPACQTDDVQVGV